MEMSKMINFPKTIKGTIQPYGIIPKDKSVLDYTNTDVEVPLEDIESFTLVHETDRNGLQLRANFKKELISCWNGRLGQYGEFEKKKYNNHYFTIRAKDEPKLSKLLRKELMTSKTIVIRTGINAGTPIARSYTYSKKELKTDKLLSESLKVEEKKERQVIDQKFWNNIFTSIQKKHPELTTDQIQNWMEKKFYVESTIYCFECGRRLKESLWLRNPSDTYGCSRHM